MKAHCGIGGTAPLILNLRSRQKGTVSFAHQSVYLTEITCSSHQTGGGVGPRARLGAFEYGHTSCCWQGTGLSNLRPSYYTHFAFMVSDGLCLIGINPIIVPRSYELLLSMGLWVYEHDPQTMDSL